MKLQNISIRTFLRLVIMGVTSTSAFLLLIFYFFTGSSTLVLYGLLLTASFFVWGIFFLKFFQKRLSEFTNSLCRTLDDMISGSERPLIIPELFEPPVRTLRATIPENESHIFR